MYLAFLLPLVFAFFAFIKKKVTIPGIIVAYLMTHVNISISTFIAIFHLYINISLI